MVGWVERARLKRPATERKLLFRPYSLSQRDQVKPNAFPV